MHKASVENKLNETAMEDSPSPTMKSTNPKINTNPRHQSQNSSRSTTGKSRSQSQRGTFRSKPYPQKSAQLTDSSKPMITGYVVPIKHVFEIEVQLHGIVKIAQIAYQIARSHDYKSCQNITEEQFIYVMKLASFVRLYSVAVRLGTYTLYEFPRFSRLYETFSNILLPDFVCTYLESIGEISHNGLTIRPGVQSMASFLEHNPKFFCQLDEEGRIVKDQNNEPLPCTIDTFYRQYSVSQYARNFVRGTQYARAYRIMNWTITTGTSELLVSRQGPPEDAEGCCHTQLEPTQLVRGASFTFRHLEDRNDWLFDTNYFGALYKHTEIDIDTYISDMIRSGYTQR